MGVTIHFDGCLKNKTALRQVMDMVQKWADSHSWPINEIPREKRTLKRVKDEADWDYTGFTEGMQLHPHPDSEPLRLEFDEDGFIQEYIKTQFAGSQCHIQVIEFLRSIEIYFTNLTVSDEGEYWETGDNEKLIEHINKCDQVLNEILRTNPKAIGPQRMPSGRIVDCIQSR